MHFRIQTAFKCLFEIQLVGFFTAHVKNTFWSFNLFCLQTWKSPSFDTDKNILELHLCQRGSLITNLHRSRKRICATLTLLS